MLQGSFGFEMPEGWVYLDHMVVQQRTWTHVAQHGHSKSSQFELWVLGFQRNSSRSLVRCGLSWGAGIRHAGGILPICLVADVSTECAAGGGPPL